MVIVTNDICMIPLKWNSRTGKTNLEWQKLDQWLPGAGGGGMGNQLQKAKETFGGVEIFYLDCGSGYTGMHICRNTSNHALKIGTS